MFNSFYNNGTAEFKRFPGKKARHLKHDIKDILEKERPNTVILQSGGNDLQTSTTLADIADELLEAGAICKRYGVEKICIGGVPARPGVQGRCYDLNRILSRRCRARNYVFIDNKYIFLGHLYDDVHLNHHGIKVLANNYLDVLNVAIVSQ